jgi:hypothetical protein
VRVIENQNPVASDVMSFQSQLAASEATVLEFLPPLFRREST